MTSKELIQKLDSHMRVNKITRKSVADKLGVSSAEVGRKLAADNCRLREFINMLDRSNAVWIIKPRVDNAGFQPNPSRNICYEDITTYVHMACNVYGIDVIAKKLDTTPAKVKRMLSSENMKLSTFLKLTEAAGVTNDYFKFD